MVPPDKFESSPPGCSFSLGIEVDGSHGESQAVVFHEFLGVETVPRKWGSNRLPPSCLFKQQEHIAVNADDRFRVLIVEDFSSCIWVVIMQIVI